MDISILNLTNEEYSKELNNICKTLIIDEIVGRNDENIRIYFHGLHYWSLYINSKFTDLYKFIAYISAKSNDNKIPTLFVILFYRCPTEKEINYIGHLIEKIREIKMRNFYIKYLI